MLPFRGARDTNMLSELTFGQYFPGTSLLHRLDPRVKLIAAILYIIIVFLAKNIGAFIFLTAFTLLLVLISGISPKVVLKGLKPLIFIIAFTAVVNIFWTTGETKWADFGIIQIYQEGVMYALLMVVRVVCMLAGVSVILTYTTTPIALTDGLERLIAPLSKIGIPTHDFSMMMTIALRFIPTLVEETDKIMKAQQARGVDFSSGGLMKRLRSFLPVIIPLFVSAFRRAEELAIAMECRCYRGGEGRTRMTQLHLHTRDFAMLALLVFAGAATVLINCFVPGISL